MHDPDVVVWYTRFVVVSHHEPGDADSGTVCSPSRWAWHPHHWRIQFPPLRDLRRRLLTRCTWCDGRSRKRDWVNHSRQWDRKRGPWWRGEIGLYHGDCITMAIAHEKCLCDAPVLDHFDYGQCSTCGKFRAWRSTVTDLDRAMAVTPKGTRMPQSIKDELVRRHRQREEVNGRA